jgi:hypothetical protein
MSTPYKAVTADVEIGKWGGLADNVKPEYSRVRNAVFRINEKLKEKGVKHKLVYSDKQPHYSYRSY